MRFLLLVAAAAVCTGSVAIACGDASHIYEAYPYREAEDCLGARTSLDVVEGDETGNCAPVCFMKTEANGQRAILVSRMCGPYPFALDRSGTDPACASALAALERGSSCLSDGGSTAPLPPADAGAD